MIEPTRPAALADLVAVSARVAGTGSRLAKASALAAFLRQLSREDVAIAVAYLAGLVRQARTGIGYAAVPVNHSGFAPWQLDGMDAALNEIAAGGKLLAYCRSGTRSTLLWSLARARAGDDTDELADIAAGGGYDLSPVRQIMDALASDHD